EVLAKLVRIAALAHVVQLAAERPAELVHQRDQVVGLSKGGATLGEPRHLHQDRQIPLDLRSDPRLLDLHYHRRPAWEARRVYLPDRRGGDRSRGALAVAVGEWTAERLLDGGDDGLGGDWRHMLAQLAQLRHVLRREQVLTGRKDLTELDESRAQLLEREAQVLGLGVSRNLFGAAQRQPLEWHQRAQAKLVQEPAQPVARKDGDDLRVAAPVEEDRAAERERRHWAPHS